MKRSSAAKLITCAGALALAVGLMSCSTTGVERRENVVSSMDDTRQYVERTKQQVSATVAAMNGLPGKTGETLVGQYKQFVKEYDKTQALAEEARKHAGNLASNRAEQQKAWEAEAAKLQDPALKQRAEARRTAQAQALEPLTASMRDTNTSFQAFMNNLNDIKKYLDQDLTPGGVASIKDVMARANQNAAPVMQDLDRLGRSLDVASARFRS
jgi:hypothetical protein